MSHFKHIAENKPAVSFLFLEMLSEVVGSDSEMSVYDAVTSAWGLCSKRKLSESEVIFIAEKLAKRNKKAEEAENSDKPVKPGLGTEEMKWLASLPPDKLCMYLADYDPDIAVKLYSEYDYELVADMAAAKQNARWHEVKSSFEAVMYGFGGHYKGDKSAETADGNVIDVDSSSKELDSAALDAIKSMGF